MPKSGLVLAGGGARGAYEVGVLYYLFVDGPRELREMAHFSVLCGTSIGALNVAATAATMHQPAVGIRKLAELWRGLNLDDVLKVGLSDLATLPMWLAGRVKRESVFPGEPVRQLIAGAVDWDRIHVNLAEGHLDALSISCTQVPTGKTVVFYETADGRPRGFSRDPHVKPVQARLSEIHALASAAIPFVFPAVPIDGIAYSDGGLRQNTPLSPALRLGSSRMMIIGLGNEKSMEHEHVMPDWRRQLTSPTFLLAKVLNALMLDHVDYDLIRLEHVNRLLANGELVFGEQFIARLNSVIAPLRGAKYRKMPHMVLRPSEDLGRLAADHVRSGHLRSRSGVTSRVVRILARLESPLEADLTSYLLFDGGYCEKLINLGIQDAKARLPELLKFFAGAEPETGGANFTA
jgi:NTE family protein